MSTDQVAGMMTPDMIKAAGQMMANMDGNALTSMMNMAGNFAGAPPDFRMDPNELREAAQKLSSLSSEELLSFRTEAIEASKFDRDPQVRRALDAATALKQEGNSMHVQSNYTAAVEKYAEAREGLANMTKSKEARVLIRSCLLNEASCYIKMKEFAKVVDLCDQVLEHETLNFKALYRRGLSYKELALACRSEEQGGDVAVKHLRQALNDVWSALCIDRSDEVVKQTYEEIKECMESVGLGHEIEKIEKSAEQVVEERLQQRARKDIWSHNHHHTPPHKRKLMQLVDAVSSNCTEVKEGAKLLRSLDADNMLDLVKSFSSLSLGNASKQEVFTAINLLQQMNQTQLIDESNKILDNAEQDASSPPRFDTRSPMFPPGFPDLNNPFAALQPSMPGMKPPGGLGMNFPGMDEAAGPFGPEMNKQVKQVMDNLQKFYELAMKVRRAYLKVRKIAPWLSVSRIRTLFTIRWVLKRFILPRVGGYEGVAKGMRLCANIAVGKTTVEEVLRQGESWTSWGERLFHENPKRTASFFLGLGAVLALVLREVAARVVAYLVEDKEVRVKEIR